MASKDTVNDDMGISDVLDLNQRLELQNDSPQPKPLVKQKERPNDDSDTESEASNHDESSLDKFQQNGFDLMPKSRGEPTRKSSNTEVDINDMNDPEQIIHMLETVDLTEEDTEILLQEAYKMNKKLKEMLRRQDMPEESSSKKTSKVKGHKNANSGSSSGSGSRSGSAFSVKKPLPPIVAEKDSSVYTIKLQRSRTSVPEMSRPVLVGTVQRSKSTRTGPRSDSTTGPKKTKSKSETKSEWNNRFNFT